MTREGYQFYFLVSILIFFQLVSSGQDYISDSTRVNDSVILKSSGKHSLYFTSGFSDNFAVASSVSHKQPYYSTSLSYFFRNSFYAGLASFHIPGYDPFLAFNTLITGYSHSFSSWLEADLSFSGYKVPDRLETSLFRSFLFADLEVGIDWKLIQTELSVSNMFGEEGGLFYKAKNSKYFNLPGISKRKVYISLQPYVDLIFGSMLKIELGEKIYTSIKSPTARWASRPLREYSFTGEDYEGETQGDDSGAGGDPDNGNNPGNESGPGTDGGNNTAPGDGSGAPASPGNNNNPQDTPGSNGTNADPGSQTGAPDVSPPGPQPGTPDVQGPGSQTGTPDVSGPGSQTGVPDVTSPGTQSGPGENNTNPAPQPGETTSPGQGSESENGNQAEYPGSNSPDPGSEPGSNDSDSGSDIPNEGNSSPEQKPGSGPGTKGRNHSDDPKTLTGITPAIADFFGLIQIEFGLPISLRTGKFIFELEPGYVKSMYNDPYVVTPDGFSFMINVYIKLF